MIDLEVLADYESRGLVQSRRHPVLPLTVWCYTSDCHRLAHWDTVTTICRGLLLDESGTVIGRGFEKFFEPDSQTLIPRDRPFAAYDKLDGTLIHSTMWNDQLVVWTKSGFDPLYIEPATRHLNGWTPNAGCTTMFEAIFPWNRIVIDYGSFDGLVLLAQVDNLTGADTGTPEEIAGMTGWFGEVVRPRSIPLSDLISIINNPDNGDNREGFVLVFPDENGPSLRLKMKFDAYKRIHRALSKPLTPQVIHDILLRSHIEGGEVWRSFLSPLPRHMRDSVQGVVDEITGQAGDTFGIAELLVEQSKNLKSRKDTAIQFQQADASVRAVAWLLLAGRESDAMTLALKMARPHDTTVIR